jgi:PAS domain S-box-containing protein
MGFRLRITPTVLACAFFLALSVAAHFSASWFEVSPGISIWYPPCGLTLALLVLLGPRYAPLVFASNLLLVWAFPDFHSWWIQTAIALFTATNYTLTAWLTRRYLGPFLLPGDTRETIIFILIVLFAPATAALGGNALMLTQGLASPAHFWSSVLNWWVGDMSGLLTVVPAIMVFGAPWLRTERSTMSNNAKKRFPVGLGLLQAVFLLGCTLLVFVYQPLSFYSPFYLCFLPLIWICFCHGLAGATLATLAITMTGLIGLHLAGSAPDLVVQFFFFEIAVACVGLGLGSAVTRRNKIERALAMSEDKTNRLLQVVEATTDFVVTADADLGILYVNTSLLGLTGNRAAARLLGRPLAELFPGASAKILLQDAVPAALGAGAWHGELALLDADGAEIPVSLVVQAHRDAKAGTVTFSLILRSIARQKQAEASRLENERRMLQVQKLESLGVLAGGIAHDFNNLLTPLFGYASLARLDLPEDSPVQITLGKIERSTERAAALCQQMLAYAGRTPTAFSEIDLSRLIQDTSQLLHVTTGKKCSLEFELARPLPRLVADPGQMRQVVMNLVLNASEAMGENQGRIVVRTRTETFHPEPTERYHGHALPPGPHVVLEVEDNGGGMPPDVQSRIFEPFFSTKFNGHGLGLAAVLGIVKSHNGAIQVKSEPGQGTLCRLCFPALGAPAADTLPPFSANGSWRGSGTVLVVDDEPEVRAVVARALEVSGFTTRLANDGLEAVEVFKTQSATLRLVLLDLTMPRMDGEQAFHAMHRINPSVPVILMSGYSQKLSLDRFVHARPAAFLSKPFDYRALQGCLRQLAAFQNG